MRRIGFGLILSLLLIAISSNVLYAQPSTKKIARDSVFFGEYKAITYEYIQPNGLKRTEELLIMKGSQRISSTFSKEISLYNFGKAASVMSEDIYAKDINNDGYNEIVTAGFTGKGNCCTHLTVHSLRSKIAEIGRFKLGKVRDFYLEDIDKDSLLEIISWDANFIEWNTSFDNSPKPLLIWKWHNNGYRLANFKFSDYILDKTDKNETKELKSLIKKRVNEEYDPNHKYLKYPPSKLWGIMLDYIYAGKPEKAESIFNKYWPEKIPGKEDFYKKFQEHLKESNYWSALKRSDF